MTLVATSPSEITVFQAIVVKNAIKMYVNTGIKANTSYTPTNMLKAAGKIVGKTYKRGQLPQAQADLETWIAERKAERDGRE